MDTIAPLLEIVRSFFVGIFSEISTNMSIDLGIKLILGYFFIIWGAFIIWVIKDITNRTANILVQTLSIFIILLFTPIFGLPIYLLIRPRSTLFEQYYEEEEAVEAVDDLEEFYHCAGCNHKVSRDFKFCPKCAFKLTVSCPSCKKSVHTDWAICPYCGEKDFIPTPKIEEVLVKKPGKEKKISEGGEKEQNISEEKENAHKYSLIEEKKAIGE